MVDEIKVPDAAADPQAYRATVVALSGDRDPLDVVAETPQRIRELIEGRPARDLERRRTDEEWSAAEILGHLLDGEIAMGFRWRMILTAERPAYPGYDEKAWAVLPKPPIDQLWPSLEAVRTYNLWLLRSIPRSDWNRVGLHSQVGPETIEDTVRAYAGHDVAHLNQLERCLAG